MAPFHYMLKAPSVSILDVIEHTAIYLTSYPWKQSRILCYACCLKGATYSFMTGSAGVRKQTLIAFFQSVDALVHYTPHPLNRELVQENSKNRKYAFVQNKTWTLPQI
jgi:hypothetical protein